jgi:glucans biosynthesis protein
MHGGAKRSGAPKGNQNAFKHGAYSMDSIELMKQVKAMMRESEELLKALHGD